MTTEIPDQKARFYMAFNVGPDTQKFKDGHISFRVPAGEKFPTDIIGLMKKTSRLLSFEESDILGIANPKCEGSDCSCNNCASSELLDCETFACPVGENLKIVCRNKDCINYVASTEGIECNNPSCSVRNDVTYYMSPIYPPQYTFLPEFNPQFKFIDYIESVSVTKQMILDNKSSFEEMLPPGETLPPLDENFEPFNLSGLVIFSVVYPSVKDFHTPEIFRKLQETLQGSPFFKIIKQEKYLDHNIATLQEIIRINQLPKTLMKKQRIVETYEDLVVPTTSKDDTSTATFLSPQSEDVFLGITPRASAVRRMPDTPVTVPKKKKSQWTVENIVLLVLGVLVFVCLVAFILSKQLKK